MCERQRRNTSRVSCLSELSFVSFVLSLVRSFVQHLREPLRIWEAWLKKKKNLHSGIVDRIHLHSSHSKSDNNLKY